MSSSKMVTRMRDLVLAAAVTAGLGFGVSQLFATSKADCTYGPCTTRADCIPICLYWFPDNGGVGLCRNGCCICAEGPGK